VTGRRVPIHKGPQAGHYTGPKPMKMAGLDADVWTLALERTRYVYDHFDHVAVSFSGGKDSTATLHVALEVARERGRLPLQAVFFDEEAVSPDTIDYVRRVSQREDVALDWYCLPVRHRNACSVEHPWWYPWDPAVPELWCRPLPPEGLRTAPDFPLDDPDRRPLIPEYVSRLWAPEDYGQVCTLGGLRADESVNRRRAMTSRKGDNFISPDWRRTKGGFGFGNVYSAYPIYDWSAEDVWRAPARFGWDHNRSYDAMEMLGLTPHQQRVAPPFGEEPLQNLWIYQQAWPELWDKMAKRVPGAAAASRYARTVLYAHGEIPQKPDDMPFETFILGMLTKHKDDARRQVAYRIRRDIERHYARTADPIVFWAPHPITRLTWRMLCRVAIRGDLKARTNVAYLHTEEDDEAWVQYRSELAAGGDRKMLPRSALASKPNPSVLSSG
jgi:predicted phosphoadenosine phosphosulfate sulfurtransferase